MNRTTFSIDIFGDKAAKLTADMRGDNREYLAHLRRLLQSAVQNELTSRQREAVMLFYFDGLTASEIAKLWGVAPSTVTRALQRGRRRLALSLKYALSPVFLDKDILAN